MDGMLGLPRASLCDVREFAPNAAATSAQWVQWQRRPGSTMALIIAVGSGGNGGNGAVGANSAAAGGGGGGSGGLSSLLTPLFFLPDTLFVSVALPGSGVSTKVAAFPSGTSSLTVIRAGAGSAGGNAAGATPGAAGAGAVSSPTSSSIMQGFGTLQFLAGQDGIIGGIAVAGGLLSLPATGVRTTGGSGGGGVPAAATVGTNGGIFNISGAGMGQDLLGGVGGATATTPGGNGSAGYNLNSDLGYWVGGTGGGSSHGSATGAGLFGGNGGPGGLGSGGGGGGGCLTGGTAGVGGTGGGGYVVIISW